MVEQCVICQDESNKTILVQAPCRRHWVCEADVAGYFECAVQSESMFPPKCCNQEFLLEEFARYVPLDISQAYQKKAQGEYAVLAK
jgi:hypothetical protein